MQASAFPLGVTFLEYRTFLRYLRLGYVNEFDWSKFEDAHAKAFPQGKVELNGLVQRSIADGYVETVGNEYQVSTKGISLATKQARRYSRKAIDAALKHVVVKAQEAVHTSALVCEVGRLYQIGSSLNAGQPDYGDLDIYVDWVPKPQFPTIGLMHEAWDKLNGGISFVRCAETDLEKFVKDRRAIVHLICQSDFEQFKMQAKSKIIYEVADYGTRKLMREGYP